MNKQTRKTIFTRGSTLTSKRGSTMVMVTDFATPVRGHFWGVILKATDPKAVGVLNHFSKDKFTLKK